MKTPQVSKSGIKKVISDLRKQTTLKNAGTLEIVLSVGNREYYARRAAEFLQTGDFFSAAQLAIVAEAMRREEKPQSGFINPEDLH